MQIEIVEKELQNAADDQEEMMVELERKYDEFDLQIKHAAAAEREYDEVGSIDCIDG